MQRVQRCCYDRAAQTIVAPTLVHAAAGIVRDDRELFHQIIIMIKLDFVLFSK